MFQIILDAMTLSSDFTVMNSPGYVTWWHHDMKALSTLLLLCEGNPFGWIPIKQPLMLTIFVFFVVNLIKLLWIPPTKGNQFEALMISLLLAWTSFFDDLRCMNTHVTLLILAHVGISLLVINGQESPATTLDLWHNEILGLSGLPVAAQGFNFLPVIKPTSGGHP